MLLLIEVWLDNVKNRVKFDCWNEYLTEIWWHEIENRIFIWKTIIVEFNNFLIKLLNDTTIQWIYRIIIEMSIEFDCYWIEFTIEIVKPVVNAKENWRDIISVVSSDSNAATTLLLFESCQPRGWKVVGKC